MKPTELRIGNLIQFGEFGDFNSFQAKITGITPDKLYFSLSGEYSEKLYSLYVYANPIPLTEEWLMKFGFEKVKNVNENTYPDFRKRSVELLTNVNGFYVLQRNEGFTDIHYVHQLQNLYHALTGEELTIKTK